MNVCIYLLHECVNNMCNYVHGYVTSSQTNQYVSAEMCEFAYVEDGCLIEVIKYSDVY